MKKTTMQALHTLDQSDITAVNHTVAGSSPRFKLENPIAAAISRNEPRVCSPVPWAAMGLARSPRAHQMTSVAKPKFSVSLAAKLNGRSKGQRLRSPKGSGLISSLNAAEAVRKS